MTDFSERLAKIEAKRQTSTQPVETTGPTSWTRDPEMLDRETKRDIASGVIGAVIGATAVVLGSIIQVSLQDLQDWDWLGISVPTHSKIGAFTLGTFLFCATGLLMRRPGWFAVAGGFLVMLAAEPRLARAFPDTWLAMYQATRLDLVTETGWPSFTSMTPRWSAKRWSMAGSRRKVQPISTS